MKKTSVLASLFALGAAVAMAAEPVPSVNAVGYVNVTLPASNQFVMIASSFDSVTGAVQRTLLDVFGQNSGLRQNSNPNKADKVYVWDVSGQIYYQYLQKTNGLFYSTSALSTPTNPVVPSGYGFFVQSPTAANGGSNDSLVTLLGQVPSVMTNSLSMVGQNVVNAPFQLICNPYPVEKSLDSLVNTNMGARGSSNPNNCDKIYIWDVSSQNYIQLGLKTPTNRWWYTSPWTTNFTPVITVAPGQAFWYQGKTNFVWNVAKPYDWP